MIQIKTIQREKAFFRPKLKLLDYEEVVNNFLKTHKVISVNTTRDSNGWISHTVIYEVEG